MWQCSTLFSMDFWHKRFKKWKQWSHWFIHSPYTKSKSMHTDGRMFIIRKNAEARSEQSRENWWCTFCSHLVSFPAFQAHSSTIKLSLLRLTGHLSDTGTHFLVWWFASLDTQDLGKKSVMGRGILSQKKRTIGAMVWVGLGLQKCLRLTSRERG